MDVKNDFPMETGDLDRVGHLPHGVVTALDSEVLRWSWLRVPPPPVYEVGREGHVSRRASTRETTGRLRGSL